MKKITLWLAMLCMVATSLSAQSRKHSIVGTIVDSSTNEPITQATIQLLSAPDSTFITGTVSLDRGAFSLSVKPGNYYVKTSYVGYITSSKAVKITTESDKTSLGTIVLKPDAILLGEAVVTAEAPQVQVKEDTLVYNSSAYRLPEGSALESLVAKLPGASIDDSGTITINGKEIKKILVDGKEFFADDPSVAMKNLPTSIVKSLKMYEKQSDLARITGIDDGEEEAVIDISVKKGMNRGFFGNVDTSMGTEGRYSVKSNVNSFNGQNQFSVIATGNNVADQGFMGGGNQMWHQNLGLNASKTIGTNFSITKDKYELGGNVQYEHRDADIVTRNTKEMLLNVGESFTLADKKQLDKSTNVSGDLKLEWRPDSMTNIIFKPTFRYSNSEDFTKNLSSTFNGDPLEITDTPFDYLDADNLTEADVLKAIRVNSVSSQTLYKDDQLSYGANLQVNRKLNNAGRNITVVGKYSYSDNETDNFSDILTHLYDTDDVTATNQYYTSPVVSKTYSGSFSYSEPITSSSYLQFRYRLTYNNRTNVKNVYDLNPFGEFPIGELPDEYLTSELTDLGLSATNTYYKHELSLRYRLNKKKYQLSAGVSFQPQKSTLSYQLGEYAIDTTRTVFNVTPTFSFRYRFSKVSQFKMMYRGWSSQPSMSDLLPVVDNSNPLYVRTGNPGLKPSFTNIFRFFYNTYDAEKQQGIMTHFSFYNVMNSVSNRIIYNPTTGGQTSMPENINGNWQARGVLNYSTALKNKKFTINTFTQGGYQNQVAYLSLDGLEADKNKTNTITLGEKITGTYRNDWFEFSINGLVDYLNSSNKMQPDNDQNTYSFSYGASTNISLPWSMTISSDISNRSRRGYSDASMNTNELVWNAQVAQNFLKNKSLTLSLQFYDILQNQSNLSRTISAIMRQDTESNAINAYCMVHLIYKLNLFGGKQPKMKYDRRRHGPPPGGGMGRRRN
ncbi:MAG: TonB-dependent receptor [Bacteroidaceae bacterium]|nr:TonB-dependent receptor [Bacteroidaceae bacterium]